MKHQIDYHITVKGMPAGAVIESFSAGCPARIRVDPLDSFPAEDAEIEFFIVDRKGYKADWLVNRMTDNDWDEAAEQVLEQIL
jgi:hypothetical protein